MSKEDDFPPQLPSTIASERQKDLTGVVERLGIALLERYYLLLRHMKRVPPRNRCQPYSAGNNVPVKDESAVALV